MRALVIYDSQFGNTEKIAQTVAESLRAGATVTLAHVGQYGEASWRGVDLLVLGCPTQGWGATKGMKAFLDRIPGGALAHTAVAVFDTRFDKSAWLTGSAARRMAGRLRKTGARLAAPPESFFVAGTEGPLAPGELAHAESWSRGLLNELA